MTSSCLAALLSVLERGDAHNPPEDSSKMGVASVSNLRSDLSDRQRCLSQEALRFFYAHVVQILGEPHASSLAEDPTEIPGADIELLRY